MAQRTSYTPGTFSWVELSTPDQAAAKTFYGGLFGWEYDERPVSDGVVYTMARLGEAYVAALTPQPQPQRDAGAPPAWNSYLTVESADEALEQACELGATLHAGPFDVFDAGRMGVLQDPQGAFFMVWQPRGHIGAGLVNAPGALSWNELASPDPEASAQFYSRLFGWSSQEFGPGAGASSYLTVRTRDGHGNGGIRHAASTEPAYWLVYFGTSELTRSLATARELGGQPLMDPIELPMGSFAAVQDPQGAVFALYQGDFDD